MNKAKQILVRAFLLLGPAMLWCTIYAHAAECRVALIIGNAAYGDKPLRNPVNDAADLAAA